MNTPDDLFATILFNVDVGTLRLTDDKIVLCASCGNDCGQCGITLFTGHNEKIADFIEYRSHRRRGSTSPPWRKALKQILLNLRKEKIEKLERKYPDFPELYNRLEP